jgi:plasmid stabilization system protein ParE
LHRDRNPTAARAVVERVPERCADLADFAGRGDRPERGRRELVVPGTPCLAVHRIVGDEVQVLRVMHGRQQEERR